MCVDLTGFVLGGEAIEIRAPSKLLFLKKNFCFRNSLVAPWIRNLPASAGDMGLIPRSPESTRHGAAQPMCCGH